MTIDELITQLRKPMYSYTMAFPLENTSKSAKVRADNARVQIKKLVMDFVGIPDYDSGVYDAQSPNLDQSTYDA